MPSYNQYSPYRKTELVNGYLDVINFIDITANKDDRQFEITSVYMHRPDLLAYDLYGTVELWWVFAARNKDIIKDPIYDLVPGQVIFLPQIAAIKEAVMV